MRVLHVIDALGVGGGAEHSLAAMLPLLRDRGVDSEVACLFPRQGGLQERLRSEGFRVEVLSGAHWPGRVRALRRTIDEREPDLVHATLVNACFVARAATFRSGRPLLNSLVNTTYDPMKVRDLGVAPWKMGTLRLVDGFTARHFVDHFHVISAAVTAEGTGPLGIPIERMTLVPRGRPEPLLPADPDAARRAIRTELVIAERAPVLINVGRQDRQKSQPDLIRAFAQVLEHAPEAILVVVGRPGDATDDIEATIAATGVGGSVRLTGHRTDLPLLYTIADALVFPSSSEGFGGTIIEAMSVGVPVVASDAPAIAELLEHGGLGVVVERGDVPGLGRAMVDILRDGPRRERLASLGRAAFEAKYEIGSVVDQMVGMYEQVVGRGVTANWRRGRRTVRD